jgi:hypothetical protein
MLQCHSPCIASCWCWKHKDPSKCRDQLAQWYILSHSRKLGYSYYDTLLTCVVVSQMIIWYLNIDYHRQNTHEIKHHLSTVTSSQVQSNVQCCDLVYEWVLSNAHSVGHHTTGYFRRNRRVPLNKLSLIGQNRKVLRSTDSNKLITKEWISTAIIQTTHIPDVLVSHPDRKPATFIEVRRGFPQYLPGQHQSYYVEGTLRPEIIFHEASTFGKFHTHTYVSRSASVYVTVH